MFKVQSLLHREGFLDADKTEGSTGYWGMFDHEAIEKFQKENGLKVAPAKNPQQPKQPPPGQLPWKDYSGNLLDNDAWDAMLSRLPAWYRPEPRQDANEQPIAALRLKRKTRGRLSARLPRFKGRRMPARFSSSMFSSSAPLDRAHPAPR